MPQMEVRLNVKSMTEEDGFTFIELLITLIVTGLLLTFSLVLTKWLMTPAVTEHLNERVKWEMFVLHLDRKLNHLQVQTYEMRGTQRIIFYAEEKEVLTIEKYGLLLRNHLNGGHVPLLHGINKVRIDAIDAKEFTLTVEMLHGGEYNQTFYLPPLQ